MTTTLGHRFRQSATVRLAVIAGLSLLLMIPLGMVRDLVEERARRAEQAALEIGRSWGGAQTLFAPVVVLPWQTSEGRSGCLRLLPEQFTIRGSTAPEILNRGIFKAIVHRSRLQLEGLTELPPPPVVDGVASSFVPGAARLVLPLSDARGLESIEPLHANGNDIPFQPGGDGVQESAIHAPLDAVEPGQALPFSFALTLRGSGPLRIRAAAGVTSVQLSSPWPDPGFVGTLLPARRTVGPDGFEAEWKILGLALSGEENAEFGVELLDPVSSHARALRATKHGILFVSLTFLVFFLFEILGPRRLHPVEYVLAGLALSLFFLLLLALAEHLPFGASYLIAAGVTTLLASAYLGSVLNGLRWALATALFLAALHAHLWTTLAAETLALLLGSLGLVIMLALVMSLTRKLDWATMTPRPDGHPTTSATKA